MIVSRFVTPFIVLALTGCSSTQCPSTSRSEGQDLFIQPYLQNLAIDGVTVMWWTDNTPGPHKVAFGTEFEQIVDASSTFIQAVGKTLHTAVIRGVKTGSVLPYKVYSGTVTSKAYSFRTARSAEDGFRFAVLGDGRTDDDAVIRRHRSITERALSRDPLVAFQSGDMVRTGDQIHWERFWRRVVTASDPHDPGSTLASVVPYYLVIGNHEIMQSSINRNSWFGSGNLDTTMARYRAYIDAPPNASTNPYWEERYYAFSIGPVTFVVLDTNNTSDNQLDNAELLPDGSTPDWEPGSEQHDWLVEQLADARRQSTFTFILMHPAPYSRGSHGAPTDGLSGYHLRALDGTFRSGGVDGVISGHDHFVERSLTGPPGFEETMDFGDEENLSYFVNGNGGHSTREAALGWQTWLDINGNDAPPFYSQYFYDWAGTAHSSYLEVDIERIHPSRWRATFRTVRDDGQIFDEIALERDEPR